MDKLRWFYRAWRYRLRLERQEILALLAHLGDGDTAVDIGAHKGAFTYWMLKQVGPLGHVYAFEPQPALAKRLLRLMPPGVSPKTVIEQKGLSSSPGTMNLMAPAEGTSPSASLEPAPADIASARAIPVEVTTLDEYVREHGIEAVHFIKCDAEGHELEVFRGAEQLLSSQHPYLLFACERRHRSSGRVDDVFDYLRQLGYTGCCLGPGGRLPVSEFDPEIHQRDPGDPGYINNFLFSTQ